MINFKCFKSSKVLSGLRFKSFDISKCRKARSVKKQKLKKYKKVSKVQKLQSFQKVHTSLSLRTTLCLSLMMICQCVVKVIAISGRVAVGHHTGVLLGMMLVATISMIILYFNYTIFFYKKPSYKKVRLKKSEN